MATITLEYDVRNPFITKALDYILSIGFSEVSHRKTGLEEAFEDIENGRITRIYTPVAKKSRLQQSLEDVDKGNVLFLAGPAKP